MESFIDIIDHIAGPRIHTDPFHKFRRRAFVIMLLMLGFVSLVQAITAWFSQQSPMITWMMLLLFAFTISSLLWTRGTIHIERSGSFILIALVLAGAMLELLVGRSPNTPLLFWSPVIIFGAYVFCGYQRGVVVAMVLMVSTLVIMIAPFVWHEAHILPGGGTVDAYRKRLLVTVVLCHAFPIFVLGMYEKFFHICHLEARELLDKLEKRKDRVFLGRLARLIVAEMEPELEKMEASYERLRDGGDPKAIMDGLLKPLHRLVYLTRRYEPLSMGALAAIERGLALEDFPLLIERFTEFSNISIQDREAQGLLFRGGQAFFLLIFLCISLRELMETPGVDLREMRLTVHPTRLDVDIIFSREENHRPFQLNQDFMHDLEARIQLIPVDGKGDSRFKIDVPIGGPEGPQRI